MFKVDYHDLPIAQRRKVLLFRATVLALVDGPCTGLCHDEKCRIIEDHACHLDTCLSRFGIPPGAWDRPSQADAAGAHALLVSGARRRPRRAYRRRRHPVRRTRS